MTTITNVRYPPTDVEGFETETFEQVSVISSPTTVTFHPLPGGRVYDVTDNTIKFYEWMDDNQFVTLTLNEQGGIDYELLPNPMTEDGDYVEPELYNYTVKGDVYLGSEEIDTVIYNNTDQFPHINFQTTEMFHCRLKFNDFNITIFNDCGIHYIVSDATGNIISTLKDEHTSLQSGDGETCGHILDNNTLLINNWGDVESSVVIRFDTNNIK